MYHFQTDVARGAKPTIYAAFWLWRSTHYVFGTAKHFGLHQSIFVPAGEKANVRTQGPASNVVTVLG